MRHSWWTLLIGGAVTYLSLYAVNQTQVQRYLTVKDLSKAQKSVWLNWPILSCLSLSTSFSGLAIYSKYYKCDPVYSGRITNPDQVCVGYFYRELVDDLFFFLADAIVCGRYYGSHTWPVWPIRGWHLQRVLI